MKTDKISQATGKVHQEKTNKNKERRGKREREKM